MAEKVVPSEIARLHQTERTLVAIRWAAIVFAFAQVLTYYRPYPPAVLPSALVLCSLFAVGNLCLWAKARRDDLDEAAVRRLARSSMALETVVTSAFVYQYTFDEATAVWALIYILPLVGAIRFAFRGAMGVMGVAGVLYALREVFGYLVYGNDFLIVSITFRMGIGFIIAAVAGSMAASLTRDRERLVESVDALEHKTAEADSVLRALSDADVGLVIGDGSRIIDANDAHCRIVGYSREEALAGDPWDLVLPLERPRIQTYFARATSGQEMAPLETILRRRDGEIVDIELSINVLSATDPVRIVTVVRDISERKRLDRMKDAFLSAVSHELRTPLTSVLGFAITLEDDRLPQPLREDIIKRLARGARKLDRLLADLLDLNRLLSGSIEARRRHVDLKELVDRAAQEWSAQSGRRLILDTPRVEIAVEPAKVERIVENLLSNAAKHTPAGTPVEARLLVRDDGVVLAVEDSGTGVPDEIRDKIFDPFQRGATPEHSPGVGIGLSIVKRFAELHGGTAWVEDRRGGGASFRVFFPGDVRMVAESADDEPQVEIGHPVGGDGEAVGAQPHEDPPRSRRDAQPSPRTT